MNELAYFGTAVSYLRNNIYGIELRDQSYKTFYSHKFLKL